MKKLLITLLILAIGVLSVSFLVACDPKDGQEDTYEIALVTDVGNIDDKSFNEGAWNGVKQYAEDAGKTYAYYRPSEDSTEARVETIGTAISKGAKVVVCPGYLFEEALSQVQTQYPNVMFLILDGAPGGDPDTATSNVNCIFYKEEQSGYLAGYAAVMDGYRKLGFLGGMDVPAVVRFGYGYIQGAEAAAEELELSAGDVTMRYWYCGGFGPTDEIQAKMSSWYSGGTDVVFACGGGIYLSAVSAAKTADKKVIGVDVDQYAATGNDSVFITSALKGLTASVVQALDAMFDNGGTWPAERAGKTLKLGAAEGGVGLPTASASWGFTSFTVEQYNALYAQLVDGTIVVSEDTANGLPETELVSVTVEE